MSALNNQAITKAYWHFLWRFMLLIGVVLVSVYGFLRALSQQINQLSADKARYDEVLYVQRQLAEQTDSLYKHMRLLNTNLIRYDRPMQRLISQQKESIGQLISDHPGNEKAFAVYQKLNGYVNQMLLLKDSIRSVETNVLEIRRELSNCEQRERLSR